MCHFVLSKTLEMQKWSYIILIIFLVPRSQALVNVPKNVPINVPIIPIKVPTKVDPVETNNLFSQIDDFFKKMECPAGLIQPKDPETNSKPTLNAPANTKVDLQTRLKAQARYELLIGLLSNPDMAKKCRNLGGMGLARTRAYDPIVEIWRLKLCFLLLIPDECIYRNRPRPVYTVERPSQVCKPYDQLIMHPSGRWEKMPVMKCDGEGSVMMPISNANSGAMSAPSNQLPVCSPSEQYVLLPSGQPHALKYLTCTFPNQTTITMPMPESGGGSPGPSGGLSAPGREDIKLGGNPEVVVIQDTKVNLGPKKQG